MKIEVGSGPNPHAGYEHCDIRPECPDLDHCCNAWQLPYPDGAAEEVFSNHVFEHLAQGQGIAALAEWHRVLASGGKCEIHVPDLEGHLRQWFDGDRNYAMAGIYGWQQYDQDVHQWGYTFETLSAALSKAGFINIVRIPNDSPLFLDVVAYKP